MKNTYMTNTYAMFDGIKAGAEIESLEANGIECKLKDVASLKRAMFNVGGNEQMDGSVFCILGKRQNKKIRTIVTVTLRKDGRKGNNWFFNVQCNPGSIKTGDNTFGNLKVKRQLQYAFDLVLDTLESKGAKVKRLKKSVKDGDIFVHSITFAQYTKPMKNKKELQKLIDQWYFMYETRVREEGTGHISLLQELGLKRSVGDQFKDSIALGIYAKTDKRGEGRKLMHLCVYNKVAEKRAKGKEIGAEEEEDLNRRARLDLTVTNYYFRSYWHIQDQITVKNLYAHVNKSFDGSWRLAVQSLMGYAIDRTCLLYMFTCPNPFTSDKSLLEQWELRRPGSKKDPELKKWADAIGLNLDISPKAHLLMKHGLNMSSIDSGDVRLSLTNEEGSMKYLRKLGKRIKESRENIKIGNRIRSITLDRKGPKYV